jgi:SulP family sulfate permease
MRSLRNRFSDGGKFSSSDVIAGLTLAAIGIPEVMGYTKIIGTPVVTGLYTMFLPALAFALLGSSRRLVVGADSATAAIVASSLAATQLSPGTDYVALTSLIAFCAGLLLLLSRLLRLGFLSNFLSQTVLVGFLSGVGVRVLLSQVPAMLKIAPPAVGGLGGIWHLITHVSFLQPLTSLISLAVVASIVICKKILPRLPAPLLVLACVLGVSAYFDLARWGVQLVGTVPGGLPAFRLPDFSLAPLSIVGTIAFSCFIVILAQSAATSSAYAFRYQEQFDEDEDLVGLGIANLTAALSGTFVVNGSPTRTALVDAAGAKSQFAQLTSAVTVLLVLLFFTRPLAFIPDAALSSVVFIIGLKLIDHRGLKDIFLQSRMEFWLAAATLLTVVLIGVEQGILFALLLSLLYHVRRSYKPNTDLLFKDEFGHWLPRALNTANATSTGMIVYWFGADLFYANVTHFISEVHELLSAPTSTEAPPIHLLVIDAGAITGVDYSAAKHILKLQNELKNRHIQLAWAHVSPGLRRDMDRHLILDASALFETLRECVEHYKVNR